MMTMPPFKAIKVESNEEYHATAFVGSSTVKAFQPYNSEVQAVWNISRPPTPAMKAGTLVHEVLENRGVIPDTVVLKKFKEYRSNEAKAWRDDQLEQGNHIVTEDEYKELAHKMVRIYDQIQNVPEIADGLMASSTQRETSYYYEQYKCRPDVLIEGSQFTWVIDFKTIGEMKDGIGRMKHAIKYGYHISKHHYCDMVLMPFYEKPIRFLFCWIQSGPPYEIVFEEYDEFFDMRGASEWLACHERYKACDFDEPKGYSMNKGIVYTETPTWMQTHETVELI